MYVKFSYIKGKWKGKCQKITGKLSISTKHRCNAVNFDKDNYSFCRVKLVLQPFAVEYIDVQIVNIYKEFVKCKYDINYVKHIVHAMLFGLPLKITDTDKFQYVLTQRECTDCDLF